MVMVVNGGFWMVVLEIDDFLEVMKVIDVFWMMEMVIDDF
jgi:hypothetical protein